MIVGHNIRFDICFLDAALLAHGYAPARAPPRRHRRARAPARPRRGAEPAALHARPPLPHRRRAGAPRATPTRRRPPRCCTRCSSGRPRSACSASTTCSRCRRCARTRRRRSSRSRRSFPACPASTCSATAAGACSTSARPPTSARGCAPTSRPKTAARCRSSCARPTRIEHLVCRGPLEAAVRELRLIQRARAALQPRVEVVAAVLLPEAHRRAVPAARGDAASHAPTARSYLGPFRSSSAAHRVREAIETPCRCGAAARRIGRKARARVRPAVRARAARRRRRARAGPRSTTSRTPRWPTRCAAACSDEPALLFAPLEARMRRLAEAERYEEAAATRDRLATLTQALQRQRAMDALRGRGAARDRQRRRSARARATGASCSTIPTTGTDARQLDVARPTSSVPPAARRGRRAAAREPLAAAGARHVRCHDAVGVAATAPAGGRELRVECATTRRAAPWPARAAPGRRGSRAVMPRACARQPRDAVHAALHDAGRRERDEREQPHDRPEAAPAVRQRDVGRPGWS